MPKPERSEQDWEDTGPGKRVKKVAKLFWIECRYPGTGGFFGQDWHLWKRYATKKQRDSALAQLNKSKNHGWSGPDWIEFRAVEE